MTSDKFGIPHVTAEEACDLLYVNPLLNLSDLQVDNPLEFNNSVRALFYDTELLVKYSPPQCSVEDFDFINQSRWHMPDSYKELDISKWVLDQCQTEEELQRVGQELLMYQERNLFPLLQFMKFLVDHFRKNNIVWGVGRGSSTASYVLFLLGVHKINAIYYDLDINEFLK